MAQSFVGLTGLDAFIQGKINQAIMEEREACAEIAESTRAGYIPSQFSSYEAFRYAGKKISLFIRERSSLPVKENADV